MAAPQYTTVKVSDFGGGIDQLSPENNVAPGFVESLSNVDPKAEGYLAKRTGYQGYAGYLPVRITRIDYTAGSSSNVCFTLDRAVDFTLTRSSPLVAYGRTSAAHAGDWTSTDSAHYYPIFHPRIKKTLAASSTTTLAIPASEHGQTTGSLLVGITESTSFSDASNSLIHPDSISIDTTTYAVTLSATNGSVADVNTYVYYLNQAAVPGSVYTSTVAIAAGTTTTTIAQGTHQLGSDRILGTIYDSTGSTLTLVEPDEVRIMANGDVQIDLTTASPFSAYIILSTCPLANYATTSVVPSSASQSVTFPVTSPFLFPVVYRDMGSQLEQVLPDTMVVNNAAGTCTISFINDGAAANFQIYWQYGSVSSNVICVDGAVAAAYTDTAPQITLWGIDHTTLYSSGSRGGWVNHVDSYRAPGDAFVVAGLGGNLFRSGSYADYASAYLMPLLYPSLRARAASLQYIGPAFWETGDTPLRTRGYITADGGAAHSLVCTSVVWDSGTGYTKYTLEGANLLIVGSLSTIISTTIGTEDYLTVAGAGYARHSGAFPIRAVTQPTATSLLISVANASVDSADWDDTGCAASASILTDSLTFTTSSPFLFADTLSSEVFANEEVVTVVSSEGAVSVLNGLVAEYAFSGNQQLTGNRTSSTLPLRMLDGTPSTTNVVKGDMLAFTGYAREIRVLSVNPNVTLAVTISGDGTTAQATLGSGTTDAFTVGQTVLFSQAGAYSGEQTITSIDSPTALSWAHTGVSAEAGFLVGHTIQMDESLAWSDTVTSSNSVVVPRRWIPVEAPDDSYTLTPSTNVYHWHSGTYDNRPIMRSVMSADNLYLATGADPAMKFDGSSIYRAGLPRWQPTLWASVDTGATGKISIQTPTITPHSAPVVGSFRFEIHLRDAGSFRAGDSFTHTADSAHYTVESVVEDTNATPDALAYIHVLTPITSATAATLRLNWVAKYYMRLNSVDANNNVVASAVVGADDNVVRLFQDAAVTLKAIGLPAWDNYDYTRLELEIYRTAFVPEWNTVSLASYYRIASIPLSFNNGDGYVVYTDTTSNDTLDTIDPTSLLTAGELGTQFSEPLIARSITSAGNKLILGNVTDYPELSIVMQSSGAPILATTLVGKRWLLRKDNTDNLTTSNMVDRAGFEWVGTSGSIACSVTSSDATTFTVTAGGAHGRAIGNWVYLYRDTLTTTSAPHYAGWYQVASVPSPTTLTVRDLANAGAGGAGDINKMVSTTLARDIPVLIGTDGNYGTVNGNTASASDSYMFLGIRRLSAAINASMRKADTSITGQSGFVPWIMAYAGNEYDAGQLVLRVPRIDSTSVEAVLPTYVSTDWRIYGNSALRSSGGSVGALSKAFPSRLLISYTNYAELFDAPTVDQDKDSVSAVDINTADGQEITAVIPFFGSSAFGAAMQSGVVVVFKSNSIYLVDLAEKAKGNNAVQKIESAGLGCTAPGSVVASKDGILFANESGMYRLKRDLTVEYIGRRMERVWRSETNLDQVALMAGHMRQATSQYKLSVPALGESSPGQAYVYDYTREYNMRKTSQTAFLGGVGSWTTYTNHPAIGWCNLLASAYMATTKGQVYTPRVTGGLSDWRDDAAPIVGNVVFGAMDFGDSSIRKILAATIVHYRARTGVSEDMTVSMAADLEEQFDALDDSSVKADTSTGNGMGDTAGRKMRSIRYTVNRRRLLYAQLQIENSQIDTPMEIAEVAYRVTGLSELGITEGPTTK